TPHGTNAKDLEYFVKYIGMSPMEALLSATAWGGPMMKLGKEIGYIREGCLADILLIDGDPLTDITVLQDQARIMAVMKDGEFHRAPPMRQSRVNRWAA
ncbi:MAG: amidohydrolase family protein, partial [Betaproteobacteria bacterium]|nr:amidohydrolase family protein [Betaproteobacteria bacterium]